MLNRKISLMREILAHFTHSAEICSFEVIWREKMKIVIEKETVFKFIQDMIPYGNYGYTDNVISKHDIDKLIERIKDHVTQQ